MIMRHDELSTYTDGDTALIGNVLPVLGKWELLYTTSDAILGSSKPPFLRPFGPIYQFIGTRIAFCRTLECCDVFLLCSSNAVLEYFLCEGVMLVKNM